jgi:WD40 repeat protein
MVRRFIGPALAGGLALAATACDPQLPPDPPPHGASPAVSVPQPTEIGGPLYPPADAPPRPPADKRAPVDPIVVRNCLITAPEALNVPSKNNGTLLFYCTDIADGEVVPEADIVVHPRTGKRYRKLREGAVVKQGQLMALMDDKIAWAERETARANLDAKKYEKIAADELYAYYSTDYRRNYDSYLKGATPKAEVDRSEAQMKKAQADIEVAKGHVIQAQEELNKADVVVSEHAIRTAIGGVVQRLYRRAGESIKALDPVAEVLNRDNLRVEGLIELQYLSLRDRFRVGSGGELQAIVERAEQTAHEQLLEGHLQPVRAVAVSKDPRKPLIVSASEDKTVRVWDRLTGTHVNWRHDVPVRAVACTPPTAEANLCLTGADDGIGRLFDLDNPESGKPVRELKGRHQGQIVTAAFAPNGQACATADNNEIIIWDVATGEVRYRISGAHRGPIKSVQFTPQAKLLTVARDNTIRVWKLGEKGAAPESTLEYRTGNVDVLGASPDGQSVLFDQGRALHVLAVADQRTEGVLHAPSESSQFSTFALFSPDGKLVIAASSGDAPLQLWRAPTVGERGTMLRRLAVEHSPPTCAAFAPDGSFAVTGTQDNRVYVWGMPDKAELERKLTASIWFLNPYIDSAERKLPIWARMTQPQGTRLVPGESVTLVIPPQEGR